jgi:hypothetical protein
MSRWRYIVMISMRVFTLLVVLMSPGITPGGRVTPLQSAPALAPQTFPVLQAQAMGRTCITPSGRCRLPSPAPINSSCCCSFACGYVAP